MLRVTLIGMATLLCIASCSAPAQIRDLRNAEANERSGHHEQALIDYRAAQKRCHSIDSPRMRRQSCAAAHLQYAELLVTMDRKREAIATQRPNSLATKLPPHKRVMPPPLSTTPLAILRKVTSFVGRQSQTIQTRDLPPMP